MGFNPPRGHPRGSVARRQREKWIRGARQTGIGIRTAPISGQPKAKPDGQNGGQYQFTWTRECTMYPRFPGELRPSRLCIAAVFTDRGRARLERKKKSKQPAHQSWPPQMGPGQARAGTTKQVGHVRNAGTSSGYIRPVRPEPVNGLVVVTVGSGGRPGADKWGDGINTKEWAVGSEFNCHIRFLDGQLCNRANSSRRHGPESSRAYILHSTYRDGA